MSKASQRRLSAQQKRNKNKRSLSADDASLLLSALGPSMVKNDPTTFWHLLGRAGTADAKHPDLERLTEVVEEVKPSIEVFWSAFHQPYAVTRTGDHASARYLGFLILDDFDGSEMPYVRTMSNWRGEISGLSAAKDLIAHLNALPEDMQREVGIWCFTSETMPAGPLHCLAVSKSGAVAMYTYVEGNWLLGRSSDRLCEMAVQYERATSDYPGAMEFDAASEVSAHVKGLLGREMSTSEQDGLVIALKKAFGRVQQAYLEVAIGAAEIAAEYESELNFLEEEQTEELAYERFQRESGGVKSARDKSGAVQEGEPASKAAGDKRDAEVGRQLAAANKLLSDALGRERVLSDTLQSLRAQLREGDVKPGASIEKESVRAGVGRLMDGI